MKFLLSTPFKLTWRGRFTVYFIIDYGMWYKRGGEPPFLSTSVRIRGQPRLRYRKGAEFP